MNVEIMNLSLHPETRKFEKYFVGERGDVFQDMGLAATNVVVHAMSLIGLEISLMKVIDNLKNQGANLILAQNTHPHIGEVLESLKRHPRDHYQAMITSNISILFHQSKIAG